MSDLWMAYVGFWKNEKYTTLNLNQEVKQLSKNDIPVFGLYGKDDGLFSETQIRNIEKLIGEDNLVYLNNCSHNLFIDQQTRFINALKKWTE